MDNKFLKNIFSILVITQSCSFYIDDLNMKAGSEYTIPYAEDSDEDAIDTDKLTEVTIFPTVYTCSLHRKTINLTFKKEKSYWVLPSGSKIIFHNSLPKKMSASDLRELKIGVFSKCHPSSPDCCSAKDTICSFCPGAKSNEYTKFPVCHKWCIDHEAKCGSSQLSHIEVFSTAQQIHEKKTKRSIDRQSQKKKKKQEQIDSAILVLNTLASSEKRYIWEKHIADFFKNKNSDFAKILPLLGLEGNHFDVGNFAKDFLSIIQNHLQFSIKSIHHTFEIKSLEKEQPTADIDRAFNHILHGFQSKIREINADIKVDRKELFNNFQFLKSKTERLIQILEEAQDSKKIIIEDEVYEEPSELYSEILKIDNRNIELANNIDLPNFQVSKISDSLAIHQKEIVKEKREEREEKQETRPVLTHENFFLPSRHEYFLSGVIEDIENLLSDEPGYPYQNTLPIKELFKQINGEIKTVKIFYRHLKPISHNLEVDCLLANEEDKIDLEALDIYAKRSIELCKINTQDLLSYPLRARKILNTLIGLKYKLCNILESANQNLSEFISEEELCESDMENDFFSDDLEEYLHSLKLKTFSEKDDWSLNKIKKYLNANTSLLQSIFGSRAYFSQVEFMQLMSSPLHKILNSEFLFKIYYKDEINHIRDLIFHTIVSQIKKPYSKVFELKNINHIKRNFNKMKIFIRKAINEYYMDKIVLDKYEI